MHGMSKACEFPVKVREVIRDRDDGCIFCRMRYRMSPEAGFGYPQIMHYIPRSQGGLGIEQNGAMGCVYHHNLLDNSDQREFMRYLFRNYLRRHYPDWDEKKLIYSKWKGIENIKEDA